jgi:hypothetical protein
MGDDTISESKGVGRFSGAREQVSLLGDCFIAAPNAGADHVAFEAVGVNAFRSVP